MAHAFTDRLNVVTWNVKFRRASVLDALEAVCSPDVLTLQEVTVGRFAAFRDRLVTMGLGHVHYTGEPDKEEKRYGNIIASRWPLTPLVSEAQARLPWPQLVGQVVVSVGERSVVVVTAHVPNGSGNGWAKIDTFLGLADMLRKAKGLTCVLTGDFNEPQCLHNGRVVTWGQEQGRNGDYRFWKRSTHNGRSGTGEDWDAPIRWFFEDQEDHDLRHAFWDACGQVAQAESHVTRGNPRWFDHMFVSADLRVVSCKYLHELRGAELSDHSALMAELKFEPPNLPMEMSGRATRIV